MNITYKDSGVDKDKGYQLVKKIKQLAKSTYDKNVLDSIGGFASLYQLQNYKNPILVSSTDGVGSKLKIAFATNVYNTVGIDLVAMCVNDVLCSGAKPLFFLDYLACSSLNINNAAALISGITQGCLQANCSLVGGETAEMPGFYQHGEYDLAGFALAAVEKDNLINHHNVKQGDIIIGISSSGVHSNGFSLIRKLFNNWDEKFNTRSLGDILLTPTKIYVKTILKILEQKISISAMAHITGGGIIENIPRILPNSLSAYIYKDSFPKLEIFSIIEKKGVDNIEMWNTFNMGIGFVLILPISEEQKCLQELKKLNERAFVIGEIKKINKNNQQLCLV